MNAAEEIDRRVDQVRQIVVIHQRIKEERQAKGTKEGGNGQERQAPSHLGEDDGMEGPMIIKAEIGGHFVHRIYVDGSASLEILYEHCFVRLRPEVTISGQWNNRQNGHKKDLCSTIYGTQNVKIPGKRRNGNDTK
ncbi:hypothetical protein Tco_1539261 [Tanacetum coccineum]